MFVFKYVTLFFYYINQSEFLQWTWSPNFIRKCNAEPKCWQLSTLNSTLVFSLDSLIRSIICQAGKSTGLLNPRSVVWGPWKPSCKFFTFNTTPVIQYSRLPPKARIISNACKYRNIRVLANLFPLVFLKKYFSLLVGSTFYFTLFFFNIISKGMFIYNMYLLLQ